MCVCECVCVCVCVCVCGGREEPCARRLIRTHLLPDVYSCCVFRNALVSVARIRLIVACRDLPNAFLFQTFGVQRY